MNGEDMDEGRVKQMVDAIGDVIKANYLRGPTGRARVFEALNALAVAAALVSKGTGDPLTVEFFREAFNGQMAGMFKQHERN